MRLSGDMLMSLTAMLTDKPSLACVERDKELLNTANTAMVSGSAGHETEEKEFDKWVAAGSPPIPSRMKPLRMERKWASERY